MPMVEFDCLQCGESFDELVRRAETVRDAACPAGGSPEIKKKLSTFSASVKW